jgi:IS5 family transposase
MKKIILIYLLLIYCAKESLFYTGHTGIIAGALSLRIPYDGHTLPPVLAQHERLTGKRANTVTCDRGYRGKKEIERTTVQIPKSFNDKPFSEYKQRKLRKAFCWRAVIEPVIDHVKSDHRLSRNFYKGLFGDGSHVLFAAMAFNFRKKMNSWKDWLSFWIKNFFLLWDVFPLSGILIRL